MDNPKTLQEKIWDKNELYNEIVKCPQTYESIMGGEVNGTLNTILRRKLNTLCDDGEIYKMIIPGTRFGKVLFYCKNADYKIVIESGRMGNKIYTFRDFKKEGEFRIILNTYWMLDGYEWVKKNNKIIFFGNVLKMI
jgi:hypothetical protein